MIRGIGPYRLRVIDLAKGRTDPLIGAGVLGASFKLAKMFPSSPSISVAASCDILLGWFARLCRKVCGVGFAVVTDIV